MNVSRHASAWRTWRWRGPVGALALTATAAVVVAIVALGVGPGRPLRAAITGEPGIADASVGSVLGSAGDDQLEVDAEEDAFLPFSDDATGSNLTGDSKPSPLSSGGSVARPEGPGAAAAPGVGDGGTSSGPQEARTAAVAGRVVHEAWGTPLAGVRVAVPGTALEAWTAEDGSYRIDGVSAAYDRCIVAVDLAEGAWRTRRTARLSVAVVGGRTSTADFRLYSSAGADGGAVRSEGWWRARARGSHAPEFEAAVALATGASRQFSGIDATAASEVLDGGRDERSRARASLLALWLSLASGEIGIDAPVDVSRVESWGSVAVSASADGRVTALDLARDIEALCACECSQDAAWRAARACCAASVPRDAGSVAASRQR